MFIKIHKPVSDADAAAVAFQFLSEKKLISFRVKNFKEN